MKIRRVVAELFHTDRHTDTKKANSRFSEIWNWLSLTGSRISSLTGLEGHYHVHYSPSLDCTNTQNDSL